MSDEAAPRAHVRTPENDEVLRRIGRNVVIFPNLKGVLLASELFDVTEEPTLGGGMRTIYRINERYELLIHREPLAVERNGADTGSDRQ